MIIDASNRFKDAPSKRGKDAAKKSIEQIGTQALQTLFADKHSKIDPLSRRTFARNFAKLLKNYDLFYPRHFKSICTDVAGSYESFRTEFGRLKNPNSKNIPANKITWENYCKLLTKKLALSGDIVSEGYIAHKLTSGTGYHPTQKSPDETDKIICSYQILADNFDHEFRLLNNYREISNFIVDCTIKDIERKISPDDEWDWNSSESVLIIHSLLSDYFREEYLEERAFSGHRFIDLTRNELKEIIISLKEIVDQCSSDTEEEEEEQERSYFFYMRQEIQLYLKLTDYSQLHLINPMFQEDFRYYPHCLLGTYIDPDYIISENHLRDFLKRNSDKNGILDPVFGKINYKDNDRTKLQYTYLVLFPDETLTKIEPSIVIEEDDWTMLVPLNEDLIAFRGSNFINTTFPHGQGSENNNLIDLLSDPHRLIARLKETAPNLKNHPVLTRKKEEEQQRQNVIDTLCNPFSNDNP